MSAFEAYPDHPGHMPFYIDYQKRYAETMRESDRIIIQLLSPMCPTSLLDIGCSTGNLLRHIKRTFHSTELTGGDLSESQLDVCRNDPALSGITFEKMDILDLPKNRYDVIIANAILYGFGREMFAKALESIHASLKPGGRLIAFDFFHNHAHEVEIIERTETFPEGHPLNFRSMKLTTRILETCGFTKAFFQPFHIKLDLKAPPGTVISRTEKLDNTERMLFRGVIYQPWCHMTAVKS